MNFAPIIPIANRIAVKRVSSHNIKLVVMAAGEEKTSAKGAATIVSKKISGANKLAGVASYVSVWTRFQSIDSNRYGHASDSLMMHDQ
jgi:hypothetical protein